MTEPEKVTLPKWFLWFVSAAIAAASPWVVWATMALTRIQVRLEAVPRMSMKINDLERRLIDHIADPELHKAGLRILEIRIDRLEKNK